MGMQILCNNCNNLNSFENLQTDKKCLKCNNQLNVFKDENVYYVQFSFNEENCQEILFDIFLNEITIPRDIFDCLSDIKFEKFYFPIFSFEGAFEADWHASSGYNKIISYVEYNQSKVQFEQKEKIEIDWKPSYGKIKNKFKVLKQDDNNPFLTDYIVKQNNPVVLLSISNFDFKSNSTIIDINDIKADILWSYVDKMISLDIKIPGDTSKDLQYSGILNNINRKIVYYPIYKVSYKYKDDSFDLLINAESNYIIQNQIEFFKRYKFPKASLKDIAFQEKKEIMKKEPSAPGIIVTIIGAILLYVFRDKLSNGWFYSLAVLDGILFYAGISGSVSDNKSLIANKKNIFLFFTEIILEKYTGFEKIKKLNSKLYNIILNYNLPHIKSEILPLIDLKQTNNIDNLIKLNEIQIEISKKSDIKIERLFKNEFPVSEVMNLKENSDKIDK